MTLCAWNFPAGVSFKVRNTSPVDSDFQRISVFHTEMFPAASYQPRSYLNTAETNSVGLWSLCVFSPTYSLPPLAQFLGGGNGKASSQRASGRAPPVAPGGRETSGCFFCSCFASGHISDAGCISLAPPPTRQADSSLPCSAQPLGSESQPPPTVTPVLGVAATSATLHLQAASSLLVGLFGFSLPCVLVLILTFSH